MASKQGKLGAIAIRQHKGKGGGRLWSRKVKPSCMNVDGGEERRRRRVPSGPSQDGGGISELCNKAPPRFALWAVTATCSFSAGQHSTV